MRKKLIYAAIALSVISVATYYIFKPAPPAIPLTTKVVRGPIVQSVEATGEVFAENLVDVGAQESGQIKELFVRVGDNVKKGDPIATIDSVRQTNSLNQQLANLDILNAKLASAKLSLSIAQKQLERETKLYELNATSAENLELAQNSHATQKAALAELQSEIKKSQIEISTAKTNLGYTDIRAPISGTIVSVPVEVGQTINSVQSAPTIAKIADLSKMEIRMDISEADIPKISVNNKVIYHILADSSKTFTAKLSSIDPGLTTLSDGSYNSSASSSGSSGAIYFYAKLKVDNADNYLKIGMTTQNKIIVQEIADALILPVFAIQNDDDGSFVIRQSANGDERVDIKTGATSGTFTQIVSGLNEGDIIITSADSSKLPKARTPRLH